MFFVWQEVQYVIDGATVSARDWPPHTYDPSEQSERWSHNLLLPIFHLEFKSAEHVQDLKGKEQRPCLDEALIEYNLVKRPLEVVGLRFGLILGGRNVEEEGFHHPTGSSRARFHPIRIEAPKCESQHPADRPHL